MKANTVCLTVKGECEVHVHILPVLAEEACQHISSL